MTGVAVLFARSDSIYKTLLGVDVFDLDRDARSFGLSSPVVAHPPCRAWSRLRHFAKPRKDEKDLARWAVWVVRHCGGVLEHPSGSALFRECGLPKPGTMKRDAWGGWVLPVSQSWFGHRAEKRTWLYVCGVEPSGIEALPLRLGEASHTLSLNSKRDRQRARPEVRRAEREATPPDFAEWLVNVARACAPSHPRCDWVAA